MMRFRQRQFVFTALSLLVLGGSLRPGMADPRKPLNLALVRKHKKPQRESHSQKNVRGFTGGSAAELLAKPIHANPGIDDAVREGRLKQVVEERQLQNSLPYFNKDGRYSSIPGPSFVSR